MELDDYQKEAYKTAQYGYGKPITYPLMGLAGEAGEVMNKLKKVYRDNEGKFTVDRADALVDELGDVLWYLAATATDLGIDLSTVAIRNLDKTQSRNKRNKIKGDGDYR